MAMIEVIKGSYFERAFTFTAAGTADDPDVVKFGIEEPSSTETIYTYGTDAEITKDSTGVYQVRVQMNDELGAHKYTCAAQWTSGTLGVVQVQGVINVVPAFVDVV